MSKISPIQHIPFELALTDQYLEKAARVFGSPLYIYDNSMFSSCWNKLKLVLHEKITIHYSVKANPNISIINSFKKLGSHFEVASVGELIATNYAGVSPDKVIFVGPGKTDSELEYAVSQNLKAIVVESLRELADLQRIAGQVRKQIKVLLRINPGIGKGMLAMGGPTQFGIELKTASQILICAKDYPNLKIIGIHGYLGTRILDWKVVLDHTRVILDIADELQRQSGLEFTFVDIGGGLGIPYHERDSLLDLEALGTPLRQMVDNYLEKYPQTSEIAFESGRFLVGPTGVFVTRVVDIKGYGEQKFVILDGGINIFGGYDLYGGARPLPTRVLRASQRNAEGMTLCGPLCTPMDRLAVDILLPTPKIGELIAFYLAGAYCFTASPGLFLSRGYPCEVLLIDNNLELIRERPLLEHMFAGQPKLLDNSK